ncbi:MAG TPA: hypothetical protein VJC12_03300 [Candidatus Paceibacterota bacterium]
MKTVSPSELYRRIIEVAPDFLEIVFKEAKVVMPEKIRRPQAGGFLSIWEDREKERLPPKLLLMVPIGDVPADSKSGEFTQEKARRLASHPPHVSSWQSRDLDREMYGGAIRAENLIFSFSGIPEEGDEILVLGIALKLGLISNEEAEEIMAISHNRFNQLFYEMYILWGNP